MSRTPLSLCLALVLVALASTARPSALPAQVLSELLVLVVHDGRPVDGAQVTVGETGGLTDARGLVTLRVSPGPATVRVERIGFRPVSRDVVVPPSGPTERITIALEEMAVEAEGIVVLSTRSERRIEDEPLRVEVISREEVEEKLLMTPGDISMLLNETAGLRVQPTAPALGGAAVRIQGLGGRYTQILTDGLPLAGGQTGALGPLQVPPMDLGQVEVIKGGASALYGPSALGGVVNLISRRPGERVENELLLNGTTLNGGDAVLWSSGPLAGPWGYTLLAGAHRQPLSDVDGDGWADLPGYRRGVLRPRLHLDDGSGGRLLVTVGGMAEDRDGGTLEGRTTPAGTSYRESQRTRKVDAGVVGRKLLGDARLVTVRASALRQFHDHGFDAVHEEDVHRTWFGEAAMAGTSGGHHWVLGAAVQRDDYEARDVDGFDYRFTVPGVFAQDEYAPASWLVLSASGRLDRHSVYGTFFSPRLSALLRSDDGWTVRASGGTGYFAPTPWTDETEAVGLGRVTGFDGLAAERARTGSVDLGRVLGPLEFNVTLFGSTVRDPLQVRPSAADPGTLELMTGSGDLRTGGLELLARYHVEGVHVIATHVYTRSSEPDPTGAGRREVKLTPRHTSSLVAALEEEGRGRFGLELYYTGRQTLEDDPYRATSRPYLIVGFLVERRVGRARLFLNAENVLDTRQTRWERLVRPARTATGLWVTDAWAPLDGRTFNAGVRWAF
jgi:iron complex outermembrane receptor protein